MEQHTLRTLLQRVADGELSPDEAMLEFRNAPFEDIGFAKIDHHRSLRQGAAEVIYGEGKSAEQIAVITKRLMAAGQKTVLITRLDSAKAEAVSAGVPLTYHGAARIGIAGEVTEPKSEGYVLVATGGTSDIPVAEEAALTAEVLGSRVMRLYDVGVAGIHRLLSHTKDIMRANAIVAAAGMEGALASVIGGIADCPVIAVPTSVGYGASFGGVSALLAMLNSCASGVSVVNIDNGFGAGYLAHMINSR